MNSTMESNKREVVMHTQGSNDKINLSTYSEINFDTEFVGLLCMAFFFLSFKTRWSPHQGGKGA